MDTPVAFETVAVADTSLREVAPPRQYRAASLFQPHLQTVPAAAGDATRRVAEHVAGIELVEHPPERPLDVAILLGVQQAAGGLPGQALQEVVIGRRVDAGPERHAASAHRRLADTNRVDDGVGAAGDRDDP